MDVTGKTPTPQPATERDRSRRERSDGTGEGSSSAYDRLKRQSEQRARQRGGADPSRDTTRD